MAMSTFSMVLPGIKSVSKSPIITLQSKNFHDGNLRKRTPANPNFHITTRFVPRHKPMLLKAATSSGSSGNGEDKRALATVLKLYNAIKNKNVHKLSDIFSDECRCVCNFFSSSFQYFQGKQQVLDFFNFLITKLGNNIEFVVQPTLHDGTSVGVHWTLDWKKTHAPLGKGYSFYIFQFYEGRALIRNVEMFMEPLFHIEPIRLKIMAYSMRIMEKMRLNRDKVRKAVVILILMAVIFIFIKPGLY